ncbi:MAG: hypothetical protein JWP34_4742 [Massilia sp.]|nr:hypothetical protein [Massilia sp.]
MTTLIAVYNSSGCVGRCDAHCYNAKEKECDCICGGANHGAGLERAIENVQAYSAEKLAEMEAKGARVSEEIKQLKLI